VARGFHDVDDFTSVIGWELDQVAFDKYHVMFQFYANRLLNVADSFAVRSPDGAVDFTYEIYGDKKTTIVDPLLRQSIKEAHIISIDRLDLVFDNGYVLSVFDNPEFCSWWFMSRGEQDATVTFPGDCEVDDLSTEEYRGNGPEGETIATPPMKDTFRRYVVRLKGGDT